MSKTVRVTAPYVTLKVTDPALGTRMVGFYEGAVVENVDDGSADHHIDGGQAVEVSKDATPAAGPFMPQGAPPITSDVKSDAPKKSASREAWVDYARNARGASDADLVGDDGKDLTKEELVAKYGGPVEAQS